MSERERVSRWLNTLYRGALSRQRQSHHPAPTYPSAGFEQLEPRVLLSDVPFAEHTISTTVDGAQSVYAIDLDGDGDADVLSAAQNSDSIAWHRNLGDTDGDGVIEFEAPREITGSANGAFAVTAADLDGDGDADVLSASFNGDTVAWYQNLGDTDNDGVIEFSAPQSITTSADGAISVVTADVDGDGTLDILTASSNDDTIAWHQNLGDNDNDGIPEFSVAHVITDTADSARSAHAADVDGDGAIDAISASSGDDIVAWYRNLGDTDGDGVNDFSTANIIAPAADRVASVSSADVDGDGDIDIFSAADSFGTAMIAWYENDGSENFTQHTITTQVAFAKSIITADVDGDGDADALTAGAGVGTFVPSQIVWHENLGLDIDGDGAFDFTTHVITTNTSGGQSVFATDLDGDGDTDALSASSNDDKIAWYENQAQAGNVAPILSGTNRLADIQEDDTENSGTLISDLIAGYVDDADGPSYGIAIIDTDDTNGAWQFTTDGLAWSPIEDTSDINALLLAADDNSRIRFIPNVNFNGDITEAITFRAWDQSDELDEGDRSDTTANGEGSAYSAETASASIEISPVNDAPVNNLPDSLSTPEDVALMIAGISVSDLDVNEGDGLLQVNLSVNHGTLALADTADITGDTNGTDGNLSLTGTVEALNAALKTLSYLGDTNFNGTDMLTVTTSDLGNTGPGEALTDTDSVAIDVLSPKLQADALIEQVQTLNDDGVLNRRQTRWLTRAINLQGRRSDTARVFVFALQVNLLNRFGVLTDAQAQPLLAGASDLIQSLTTGSRLRFRRFR